MAEPRIATSSLTPTEVRRRAVAGVTSIAGREAAIRALGLLGNVVLVRLLSPKDLGALAFGYTLIAFGSFLADGGIGAQMIQRSEEPTMRELKALLGFTLCAAVAVDIVIAGIGLPLGRAGELAALMALSLPISALCTPYGVVAERTMSYRPIVVTDIVRTLSYNVSAVLLVIAGLGVWGLACAVVLSAAIGTGVFINIAALGFVWPTFSLRVVRPLLRFGLQFQSVAALNTFRDQGLNVVTAAIGGLPVLGVWSVANRVLQPVMLVFNSMWRVSFPAVSRLIESGDDPRPSIERALRLTTTFTGFFVIAIGGSAPAVVPFAFGAKWDSVIAVLPWAAAGIMVAGPISVAAAGFLYARRESRVVLRAVAAHTTTWFAVAVPLLPQLGAEALGIGWCVGALVDAAVLSRALRRLEVRVFGEVALPVLTALVGGSGAWLIATALSPPVAASAASVITGEAVYLAVMFVARRSVLAELYHLLGRSATQLIPAGA